MVNYIEQNKVVRAMIRWSGGFVSTLGLALMKADPNNAQKIKDAFPEYCTEYLKRSKLLKE